MKATLKFTLLLSSLLLGCNNKNRTIEASGVFEAKEIMVSANGNGEIMQLIIEEGQKVKSFEPLGIIDTTQLYLKKRQLQINAQSINNQIVNITKQTAALHQQIETAKTEKKRTENLLKSDAVTSKQLDDINAQIAQLEKQLDATQTTIQQGNEVALDSKKSIQIQIDQTNDQIKKSIIQSPIHGTILTKYAEQGELVVMGKILFKVADMDNIYLRVYITADQLTLLKVNQEVNVFADYGKSEQKVYKGIITWISDKSEFTPKTIQTKDERASLVYAVKILVKNDGYLRKGMYGEIQF